MSGAGVSSSRCIEIEDDIFILTEAGDSIQYKYFLDGDELHLTYTKALIMDMFDYDAATKEIMEAMLEPLDEDYVLGRIVLKRKS